MTTDQYKTLLSLYKWKIKGESVDDELSRLKLKAKIELDSVFINEKSPEDIQEFINELELLWITLTV